MTRMDIKRIFVALAALVGLLGLGSARAAVYTAVWDPVFGPDFPNLGWKGQSSFFVPTSCLPVGSGLVTISNSEGCDGNGSFAFLQSASVDLYSLSTGCLTLCLNSVAPPTNTLTFNPETLTILNLRFFDGVLIGLETTQSNGVDDTIVVGGPETPVTFYLKFLLDPPPDFNPDLARNGSASTNAFGTYNGPVLSYSTCCDGPIGQNSFPPDSFVITRIDVPEPASLSLAALGLAAALGWGRSRRRRQG